MKISFFYFLGACKKENLNFSSFSNQAHERPQSKFKKVNSDLVKLFTYFFIFRKFKVIRVSNATYFIPAKMTIRITFLIDRNLIKFINFYSKRTLLHWVRYNYQHGHYTDIFRPRQSQKWHNNTIAKHVYLETIHHQKYWFDWARFGFAKQQQIPEINIFN